MSPLEFIIKKSLHSKVNSAILRSNSLNDLSLSALSGLFDPTVSRMIKYSTSLPFYISGGIFLSAKFIPEVHLP
jgi:hypothetical protein